MGPCPFRHGNGNLAISLGAYFLAARLQWGHVLSDMVTQADNLETIDALKLQWGHVLSDMVTNRAREHRERGRRGFNGAMSFQTW